MDVSFLLWDAGQRRKKEQGGVLTFLYSLECEEYGNILVRCYYIFDINIAVMRASVCEEKVKRLGCGLRLDKLD